VLRREWRIDGEWERDEYWRGEEGRWEGEGWLRFVKVSCNKKEGFKI
jgi:hypothetical protein